MDAKHCKSKPGPKDKLYDQVRMDEGFGVVGRADPKNKLLGEWEDQLRG